MSKTTKSNTSTNTHKSNHNYNDLDANNDMSDELSAYSSEEDEVTSRKSRKIQPTDAADYEDGGGM
ncbi:uncharacterized protein LOC129246131 [Anastrepha obliqua]|uniref:uncharacterized protein LOC129246131 n=1 Tax=Anastrepha obliqua TaxID=95512 RepID=UPI00240A7E14|nr:uncharacterized protein LOC129246131 [Anastrepha obliqua]